MTVTVFCRERSVPQDKGDHWDRPGRLFLVPSEPGVATGLSGVKLGATRLGHNLGTGAVALMADLYFKVVRVSDQVVEPGRVLLGPCGRGENVDPVQVARVSQVHHRAGASLARLGTGGGEQQ